MIKLFFVALLLFVSNSVLAAGFYLCEVGTPASLGTACAANPTNTFTADVSWTNPAGMVHLEEDQKFSGVQLVLPVIEFDPNIATGGGDDGGNAGVITPVPSFFYVKKINDRFSAGFSATGAIGGGVNYGHTFAGRYSVTKAILGAIGLSPSVSFKVNDKLSVGAGVSILYTRFDESIALNPAVIPGGTITGGDGTLRIKQAEDWGYQPFFGLQYKLTDRALLGIVYRAETDVDLEGSAVVENLNLPIGVNEIEIEWDNPQWIDAGLRYRLSDNNLLFLNGGWQEWSAFSKNQLLKLSLIQIILRQ